MAPMLPLLAGALLLLAPRHGRAALPDGDVTTSRFVQNYLSKFGYAPPPSDDTVGVDARVLAELRERAALRSFQRDVGLPPTGYADRKTLRLMMRPRCGNVQPVDRAERQPHDRKARFVPAERKWPHSTLTWRVADPQRILKPYDAFVVRNALSRALSEWSTATGRQLRFREQRRAPARGEADSDIVVYFAHGEHNDSLPFDGPGGVVAHGFYPTAGMLHFDAAESWTLNLGRGVNIYQTAVHEIGHLLGLAHSADSRAVMFPINRPYDPAFALADDDIRGVRYLYTPWAWNYYLQRRYGHGWRDRQ